MINALIVGAAVGFYGIAIVTMIRIIVYLKKDRKDVQNALEEKNGN